MPFFLEETPLDEVVDDSEETLLRDDMFNVDKIPEADFSTDAKTLETISRWDQFKSEIPMVLCLSSFPKARLENIGILALDFFIQTPAYLDRNAGVESCICILSRSSSTNQCSGIQSLLHKNSMDPTQIGRIDIIRKSSSKEAELFGSLFAHAEVHFSTSTDILPSAALFRSVQWIDSRYWNGRNAVVVVEMDNGWLASVLIGPDAIVVVEGQFIHFHDSILLIRVQIHMDRQL